MWRLQIIHRKSVNISFYADTFARKDANENEKRQLQMPIQPISPIEFLTDKEFHEKTPIRYRAYFLSVIIGLLKLRNYLKLPAIFLY